MKYYDYFSGGMTPAHLMAAMSFAFLGWAGYKIITALQRDRASQRTPAKFSWKFWLEDNIEEAIKGLVIMFILVRFASEILAHTIPNSAEVLDSKDPMWIYAVVGAAKGYILNRLKKKLPKTSQKQ